LKKYAEAKKENPSLFGAREFRNPDLLTLRVLSYFGIVPREFPQK